MPRYMIPVYWTMCGAVKVEASCHDEAIEKARAADRPGDSDYAADSFHVHRYGHAVYDEAKGMYVPCE